MPSWFGNPGCQNPNCPLGKQRAAFWNRPASAIIFQALRHCSLECFEQAAQAQFQKLLAAAKRRLPAGHRIPLGLLLLERGLISQEALRRTLQVQRQAGRGRIGEWLEAGGHLSCREVALALGAQWSLPVFPITQQRTYLECADLVPIPLLESSGMVPVHYNRAARSLYVAFAEYVDYPALKAIERMLDCRAEPCIAEEAGITRAIEEMRQQPRPPEIALHDSLSALEMARTARSYAAQLNAASARLEACNDYLWLRFDSGASPHHLLFRRALPLAA